MLVQNLPSILKRGHEEDAHEYLMSLFNKLELSSSKHKEISASLVKEIFGGRLLSELQCNKCGNQSDTNDFSLCLSLNLDIEEDTLEHALTSFTRFEGVANVSCNKCSEKVYAQKRMVLDQPPQIAALHLNRFRLVSGRIEKIDRKIEYPLVLDFNPYTKGAVENKEALRYKLHGFVVHKGETPTTGHYYSYIRTSPDTWYIFDDEQIWRVTDLLHRPEEEVLSELDKFRSQRRC